MERSVIIVGGGGHAKVLSYTLQLRGATPIGYTDRVDRGPLLGVPYLGGDEVIRRRGPEHVALVNGIGGVGRTDARWRVFADFTGQGYQFVQVLHPSAIIASDVEIGQGAQVLAGAVIMPGSRIGENAIVNTRASVDHDCNLGAHVHIAPGATLSGGVTVEEAAHVGTGASIIQGINVGRGAIVGAGAVVVRSVRPGVTVIGVPARESADVLQSVDKRR